MASTALAEWRGARAARIDELLAAHASVGGTGTGRRYRTEQLNWSITLRIAAEFQGFARDLHDLASNHVASQVAHNNVAVAAVLGRLLRTGRKLDSGNPNAGNLGSDFGKLGMDLWPELKLRYPSWASPVQHELSALLTARNGIAHADERALNEIERGGYPLRQLKTVRAWHGSMNRLAGMMDTTVGEHVGSMFGGSSPW